MYIFFYDVSNPFPCGAQWYVSMNFFVHALMYSYYACRAMKIKIARPIQIIITALQLSQMFVGVAVQIYIYKFRKDPWCPTHYYNLRAAVIMYGSYYLWLGLAEPEIRQKRIFLT